MIRSETSEICSIWSRYGQKLFKPSHGLTSMLAATELYNTDEPINSPAPVIHIDLPTLHPIRQHLKFIEYQNTDWTGITLLSHQLNDTDVIYQIYLAKYIRATNENNLVLYEDSVYWFIKKPSWTVKSIVEDALEPHEQNSAQVTLRFILNLLVYLTSSSATMITPENSNEYRKLSRRIEKTTEPKKIKKLQKHIDKLKKEHGIILGPDIILDRTKEKSLGQSLSEIGRKVNVRFWVIGHWRNQACGSDKKGHKLIWIKPHMKGPEDAPIQLTEHTVR